MSNECVHEKAAETAAEVKKHLETIVKFKEQANTFIAHEGLMDKAEKTDYSIIQQIGKDFEPYATLWITVDDWIKNHATWTDGPFENIDAEDMERNVLQYAKNLIRVIREPKFKDKAPLLKIAEDIKAQIDDFKPVMPTIKYLRQQGMKERHWNQLSKELGFEVRPGTTLLTLQDVYSLDLQLHETAIQRVSEVAAREYGIESSLQKMKKDWQDVKLGVIPYKKTGSYILTKDIMDSTQEILDDHMLQPQALNFSQFKKIFETEIEQWDAALKLVQNIFDEWKSCQKQWMYLDPIFQSDDIARQLPNETPRFASVNRNLKTLTGKAFEVQLTMPYCTQTEKVFEMLKENNANLDLVMKGLMAYLENKRSSFARFYFLSDDELLTILSLAKDPKKIQPHFSKVFENIDCIDMLEQDSEMIGMFSQKKERVPFVESVFPRKGVENWLTEIESTMKRSIRKELENGMQQMAQLGRKQFILQAVGQVGITVSQIYWTAECEKFLKEHGSLDKYVPTANDNLMLLVETVRQKLTDLQRVNLGALITIEVHARDIVETLSRDKVTNALAFEWVSQLRTYWRNDDCYLHQVEAQFRYGGEYLGNTTRLVITPLTDRIYLTLTGAMHMFLGSAPAGPAGTGKTETVKDLAKAIAKQCVVFNCQEGMTFASMGKMFKGLANAGAWACFDEFNRIDVEVLSVVAQQVATLQEAARSKQYRISFEGTEIVVDPTYSVFITMNPGYAGRTELPDNLKVLFRPVACMVPDYAMIAEIRLFSYGYADSRKLSQKIVSTFRLSSEQLSAKDHYDFGMRAVNTVISAAGLMKRQRPDEAEDILLLRALRDSNAPKFLLEDLLLFGGIIKDLFPGVTVPEPDYGNVFSVLQQKCISNQLEPTPLFIQKCIQLYEMTVLRHGQMAVGPTMGGKSSAIRVLKEALTSLRNDHKEDRFAEVWTYTLNPKSVTMAQLYGAFDEATGEWRDGLIGVLFRLATQDKDNSALRKWIVFDGPVDALWIESMNTVLDENKKLCLISGEIISMTQWMNIWFEVEDLSVASPATVSRAGMIYLEPTGCIGVNSFVASWLKYRLPPTLDANNMKENLKRACESLFEPLLKCVYSTCQEFQPTVWPNLVTSFFNLYCGFLEPYTPTRSYDPPQDKLELLHDIYMHLFVFCVTWSIGGALDAASRKKFDKFFRDEMRRNAIILANLPDQGTLYEYEFVVEERKWIPWLERAPAFNQTVTAANFSEIIIPTADVIRYKYLNKHLLAKGYHVLNVGPTGTGKTALINELLMKGMASEYTPIFFTLSARTSANQTQDLIFSKFEVRRRASPQIWGAPVGKKFVIFIDDVNMPLREKYGAQPPLELLRQWFDQKGWYDRKLLEFYTVVDTIYVGAMGPPGGGRNKCSNRVLRHFNHIAFPDIDDENMKVIFSTIVDSFLKSSNFNEDVRQRTSSIIDSSIEIYNTIMKELRPRPSRPHYLFNMRDMAKICSGLLSADPKLVQTGNSFTKLWLHETTRSFRDRLIDDPDRHWFDDLLKRQLQKHFKLKWTDIVAEGSPLLYIDFMNPGADIRRYDEVKDLKQLITVSETHLEEYNNAHPQKKMGLVMFLDAIEHVARIARVIRKPAGHALLLGVGGSGRQSASRLAAFVNEFEVRQVEISKGYSMNTWREDLKTILRAASFKNLSLVFTITDTQIVHENMLEDVNNLLNSGEVPNLFFGPDIDELNSVMKPVCVAESIPLDKVNMYARFIKFCRTNMHICLCMSPMGEPFRNRLRMFPALVNCCTIDWFSAWPDQALRSVAKNFFAEVDTVKDEATIAHCVHMCVFIHQSVERMSVKFLEQSKRHNYVTPTSYLEQLKTFRTLMGQETAKVLTTKNRLINGLEKLRQTEKQVAELQATLAADQPKLIQRQQQIEELVVNIKQQTEAAEVTRVGAIGDEQVAAQKEAECVAIFQKSEALLAEAQPALDAADAVLASLDKKDFTEVNGYAVWNDGVTMTMDAVCILFLLKPTVVRDGQTKRETFQPAAKELLGNPGKLLNSIRTYDKEAIVERTVNGLKKYIDNPDFTPKNIENKSKACGALCMWVIAMYRFYFTLQDVKPLRAQLAAATKDLEEVRQKLEVARAKLKDGEDKLAMLNRQKETAEQDKTEA